MAIAMHHVAIMAVLSSGSLDAASHPVEPRTAAAVLAADDAWGAAEARGDADFVDWLLMPDYRSVGPTGQSTSKTTIVSDARSRAGSPTTAATIADWKAAHPLRGDVSLFEDMAVLTWVSTKASSGEPISSRDVLVYPSGHCKVRHYPAWP